MSPHQSNRLPAALTCDLSAGASRRRRKPSAKQEAASGPPHPQNPNPGARVFSCSGSVCLHAAKPVAARTRRSARLATGGKTGARSSGQPGSRSCAYRATGSCRPGRGSTRALAWKGRNRRSGGAVTSKRSASIRRSWICPPSRRMPRCRESVSRRQTEPPCRAGRPAQAGGCVCRVSAYIPIGLSHSLSALRVSLLNGTSRLLNC